MTWLRVLTARLLGRVHRDRSDEEFDDELRFHLQMETDANVRRGMTPQQARRAARLRLGGIEGVREEYRDVRGLPLVDTCLQDLRYSARGLAVSAKYVVHPEHSEQNGVAKQPFQTEEAPDEDSS